ncbi:TPA: hypothetical protein ACP32N_005086 [Pseudomonas aeruginosa]
MQKIITTTDQGLIARSLQWQAYFNVWIDKINGKVTEEEPQGETSLIPPGALEHFANMVLSWTVTICKILGLTLVYFWKQGLKLLRKEQPQGQPKGTLNLRRARRAASDRVVGPGSTGWMEAL